MINYNNPAFLKLQAKMAHDAGIPALERLYELAQGDSRESYIVGLFLISCYKGKKYPFNMQFLKELQPNSLMDCIAVIHLEYHARQEIFDYLNVEVKDFEKLSYQLLKIQTAKPIPREININGHTYRVDLTYKAGAKAGVRKVGKNPHRAFSQKNIQWQYGYDNECKGHHQAQGYDFDEPDNDEVED